MSHASPFLLVVGALTTVLAEPVGQATGNMYARMGSLMV